MSRPNPCPVKLSPNLWILACDVMLMSYYALDAIKFECESLLVMNLTLPGWPGPFLRDPATNTLDIQGSNVKDLSLAGPPCVLQGASDPIC